MTPEQRSRARRAVVAAAMGNALEWFDIIVYGFFAVVIAELFFPAETDPTVALLLTFATLALTYFIRPIGAMVIGNFGDRRGRKAALTLTIALMTLGVGIMAFTPTYAAIGVTATVLMLLSRLIQGFSAGGEFGSATAFMIEHSPDRKAFYASWQVATQGISMLLAGSFGLVLNTMLSQEALYSWGWRVPFIFGLLIGPIGWWIRSSMDDTPEFLEVEERDERVAMPLGAVLTQHLGRVLTAAACVGVATMSVYLILYMPTFSVTALGLPSFAGYIGAAIAGLVTLVLAPMFGALADRVGTVPIMRVAAVVGGLVVYPMFLALINNPTVWMLTLVEVVLGVVMAAYFAPLPSMMAAIFPTAVRTTGMSVAYNVGVTTLGGLTPLVLAWLVDQFADVSPAIYYIAVVILSLVGLTLARRVYGLR
ncbi:MFS transporter [Serinicoccus chungangensis]|uniref:MFS transporter n=1 Tax=Serinicoccus chungangensis TaxID=767452 RepID=UPI001EE7B2CB|nr:MFS transporter [Serinicoccus chungangensis]